MYPGGPQASDSSFIHSLFLHIPLHVYGILIVILSWNIEFFILVAQSNSQDARESEWSFPRVNRCFCLFIFGNYRI